MIFHTAGGGTYNLNSSISSTATSITLSSFTEPVSGTPYTMALLNTDIAYGTIAPRTSSSEFISFTGITQNADGTALLTGVTRGLAKKYPYTTDASFKLPHSGQSQFILSDAPQVFEKYVSLNNAETITGLKTFPGGGNASAPVSGTVYSPPTNNLEYASKEYVDNVAGGIAITDQILISGTAGENLTVGYVVYQKTSDGKWYKVKADTTTTFQGQALGIAQATVSTSGAVNILIYGIDSNQTGLVAGTAYYATDAGGLPSTTPGTNTVFVGYGTTTSTNLLVDFRSTDIPYHGEKLALVGDNTDIAIGTGNKYMSQTGFQKGAEVYAATSTGNDTYIITLSPVPTSLVNGMTLRFKADVANTGAATLNVNSLGALAIVTGLSTALATGDILANQVCVVVYNSTGTVWQLVNPASAFLSTPTYLGSWTSASNDTATQATTGGFVVGYMAAAGGSPTVIVYTDASNPPTTQRSTGAGNNGASFCVPVKKNDYYKITTGGGATVTAFFIPIGT